MDFYTVKLVATVDAYIEVEVEAGNEESALESAKALIADEGVTMNHIVDCEGYGGDADAYDATKIEA